MTDNKYHVDDINNHNIGITDILKQDQKLNQRFILDIGCNQARNLYAIKKIAPQNNNLYGVDINDYAIEQAKQLLPSGYFFVNNIERLLLPPLVSNNSYDYILLIDVLEHLHNPDKVLLYIKQFLKPDGKIICNIPNIMHWSVLYCLIKQGTFPYQETGLLDKTHIHFFTFYEFINMIIECGYKVDNNLRYTILPIPEQQKDFVQKLQNFSELPNKQYVFKAFDYLFILTK